MKTIKEKNATQAFMQDLDELKHVFFLFCAEFAVKKHQQAAFMKKTILNRV